MNFLEAQVENSVIPVQTTMTEELVSNHFENVFALFNSVIEDHRASLTFTEEAFRSAAGAAHTNTTGVYHCAVSTLLEKGQVRNPYGLKATVCFLLKELENFRYQEIAEMVQITREEVKHHIAEVRGALLQKIA